MTSCITCSGWDCTSKNTGRVCYSSALLRFSPRLARCKPGHKPFQTKTKLVSLSEMNRSRSWMHRTWPRLGYFVQPSLKPDEETHNVMHEPVEFVLKMTHLVLRGFFVADFGNSRGLSVLSASRRECGEGPRVDDTLPAHRLLVATVTIVVVCELSRTEFQFADLLKKFLPVRWISPVNVVTEGPALARNALDISRPPTFFFLSLLSWAAIRITPEWENNRCHASSISGDQWLADVSFNAWINARPTALKYSTLTPKRRCVCVRLMIRSASLSDDNNVRIPILICTSTLPRTCIEDRKTCLSSGEWSSSDEKKMS